MLSGIAPGVRGLSKVVIKFSEMRVLDGVGFRFLGIINPKSL